MNALAYVCEGYLFVYNPWIEYSLEVLGSFNYNRRPINIIMTHGKSIEEIRIFCKKYVADMQRIKDQLDPSIYYAAKKIESMSKKEPLEIPFQIELKQGDPEIFFDGNNSLTIFLQDISEKKIFYFPAPEGFSEKAED